jgi:hypothetical protein
MDTPRPPAPPLSLYEPFKAELAELGPYPDPVAEAALKARMLDAFGPDLGEDLWQLANSELKLKPLLARLETAMPPKVSLSGSLRFIVIGFLVFAVGGFLLEWTIGNVFVFTLSAAYFKVWPWLFVALLLPIGFVLQAIASSTLAFNYPNSPMRRRMSLVITTVLLAGWAVVAPFGWAALAGRVLGTPVDLDAKVVDVDERRLYSPLCKRKDGKLRLDGVDANLCFSWVVVGPMPKRGASVRVKGLASALGVYVQEIR